ncbi:MAG: hypothetical protein IPN83_05785 [Holophagales bacterium]|nr:hypothetical protein [Holophagales bacterium]
MVLKRRTLTLTLALALGSGLAWSVPLPTDELEGVVRMSRAEYDKLKDAAERASEEPEKVPAPVPPSVENVAYEARVAADRIALELTADVVVKAPAGDARVTLPRGAPRRDHRQGACSRRRRLRRGADHARLSAAGALSPRASLPPSREPRRGAAFGRLHRPARLVRAPRRLR